MRNLEIDWEWGSFVGEKKRGLKRVFDKWDSFWESAVIRVLLMNMVPFEGGLIM